MKRRVTAQKRMHKQHTHICCYYNSSVRDNTARTPEYICKTRGRRVARLTSPGQGHRPGAICARGAHARACPQSST
eukprot:9473967-Pyramimonas_sp.AAC.3